MGGTPGIVHGFPQPKKPGPGVYDRAEDAAGFISDLLGAIHDQGIDAALSAAKASLGWVSPATLRSITLDQSLEQLGRLFGPAQMVDILSFRATLAMRNPGLYVSLSERFSADLAVASNPFAETNLSQKYSTTLPVGGFFNNANSLKEALAGIVDNIAKNIGILGGYHRVGLDNWLSRSDELAMTDTALGAVQSLFGLAPSPKVANLGSLLASGFSELNEMVATGDMTQMDAATVAILGSFIDLKVIQEKTNVPIADLMEQLRTEKWNVPFNGYKNDLLGQLLSQDVEMLGLPKGASLGDLLDPMSQLASLDMVQVSNLDALRAKLGIPTTGQIRALVESISAALDTSRPQTTESLEKFVDTITLADIRAAAKIGGPTPQNATLAALHEAMMSVDDPKARAKIGARIAHMERIKEQKERLRDAMVSDREGGGGASSSGGSSSGGNSNSGGRPSGTEHGKNRPIVVDLDGDGAELITRNNNTGFDLDNDGYIENSGWVAPDDGLLVIDIDGDGNIDKAEELAFASVTIEDDTDLEALKALYDSNKDGWLDANDAEWSKFRIWQDKNSNAIVDEGELKEIADWNISKFSLTSDKQEIEISGNQVYGQASYVKTDGTIGKIADVAFDMSLQGYRIIETADGVRVEIEGAGAIFVGKSDLPAHLNLKDSDFIAANGSGGNDVLDASGYGDNDKSKIEGQEEEILSVTLAGNAGDDILTGGAGNDYLDGGVGKDHLSGGAGDDTLFVDAEDGPIDGGAGADFAAVTSEKGVTLDLAATNIEAARGWTGDDYFNASSVTKTSIGKAYDPDGIYEGWGVTLDGGSGNDTLIGSDGADSLSGGIGADKLIGGKGNDYLVADGFDEISAGEGVDTIIFTGSDGVVRNAAEIGGEILLGTEGDDKFTTDDSHVVVMIGDRGDDYLSGSRGNDTFSGGRNDDLIEGGAGDDTYRFSRGDGRDDVLERDAFSIQVQNATEVDRSVFQRIYWPNYPNSGNSGDWDEQDGYVTVRDYNLVTAPEDVHLDAGNDTIEFGIGIAASDLAFELRGNDLYIGIKDPLQPNTPASALSDSIRLANWQDPKDRVENIKFAGIDTPALIADLVTAQLGADAIAAAAYNQITGTAAAETLTGLSVADRMTGGAGNDILDGKNGDDRLEGGAGNDSYAFGRGYGWDTVKDENRWLQTTTTTENWSNNFQAYLTRTVTYTTSGGGQDNDPVTKTVTQAGYFSVVQNGSRNVTVTEWKEGDGGSDTLVFGAGITVEDVAIKISGDDLLIALRRRDAADGDKIVDDESFWSLADQMRIENWSNGKNRIESFKFADGAVIDVSNMLAAYTGESGDEIVSGDDGANWLAGSAGDDVVLGLGGNDVVLGGTGDDIIAGGEGADLIYGGEGKDRIDYSDSTAAVTVDLANSANNKGGDAEGDQLFGIEDVVGSRGNDKITGGAGENQIWGGDGADEIDGGDGVDTASYADSIFGVTVDLGNNANNKGGFAAGDTLSNIENLVGSGFDDSLTGNAGANRLEGGYGKDHLAGGDGIDTATYENALSGVEIDLGANLGKSGEAEGDTFDSIEQVVGSDFADRLVGNGDANKLEGGKGGDIIEGGAGADELIGGEGNDAASYAGSAGGVVVNLSNNALNAGNDAAGDTLSEIENVIGSAFDDNLTGDDKDNILDGGRGNDSLAGGAGNDTVSYAASQARKLEDLPEAVAGTRYEIVHSGVTVNLTAGTASLTTQVEVRDADDGTLLSIHSNETFSDSLAGIENVVGTAFDDSFTGNDAANKFYGGAGLDTLSGGGGDDWLDGGTGNDVIDGGSGTDTVNYSGALAGVTANLATGKASGGSAEDQLSNVENVVGGIWNDDLTGNAEANRLEGGAGNDRLDGGLGADTLLGGFGDDTYVVDHVGDKAIEDGDYGVDRVESSVDWTLSDWIENLTLTDAAAAAGTGNKLANVIIGSIAANRLEGLDGDDTLDGGKGADTLVGGKGDDIYVVDDAGDQIVEAQNEGLDRVIASLSVTLGDNVEVLELAGTGHISGTGNDLDNEIVGNEGDNILAGGKGDDHIFGGLGADSIDGGEGRDLVSYAGSAEGVTVNLLSDPGKGGEAEGDTLANVEDVTGSKFDDILTGSDGDNRLIGGAGNDKLAGGNGNDQYVVDSKDDQVTELSGEGEDSVESSVAYVLTDHVEHLTLTGTADIDATGNALDNKVAGNDGDNVIDGGAGKDALEGGRGDDVYRVDDTGDTVAENDDDGEYWGHDRVESAVSFTLGKNLEDLTLTGANHAAGTGNELGNAIIGNDGDNDLRGLDGDDTLRGGKGADNIVGGAGIDTALYEESATGVTVNLTTSKASGGDAEGDSIFEIENLVGSDHADHFTGDSGDNRLDGGKGIDTLVGGAGNDTYVVDNALDGILENANEGTDRVESSVSYVLGANIEELRLTGRDDINATGNALDNKLYGSFGANRLDGGAGKDAMAGGAGNDTYVVDQSGDEIVEHGGGGIDTVESTISYKLGSELENLTLTGGANLDGTGNERNNQLTGNTGSNKLIGFAGNDTLAGGAGGDALDGGDGVDTASFVGSDAAVTVNLATGAASGGHAAGDSFVSIENITGSDHDDSLTGSAAENRLDGGKGNDAMAGGLGSDTYVVDSAGDMVSENANAGRDTVELSKDFVGLSYALSAHVENLVILGKGDVAATGNGLENILIGGDGNNRLDGGAGADQMAGGFGNDVYVVDHAGDTVSELADRGTDAVEAEIDYTLGANVENLVLSGSAALKGTGNALGNTITGNTGANELKGMMGDDTLAGAGGADQIDGGEGNDTASYAGSAAAVTVNLAAGTAIGGDAQGDKLVSIENLTGSSHDDALTGDDKGNRLDGGVGNDSLTGGKGNDIYVVDQTGDSVSEAEDGGIDTVESGVTYALSAHVEHLSLTGEAAINGTGNALDNELRGNKEANTLSGGDGNDLLIGGSGADQLVGGAGDDTASYLTSASAININLSAGTASGGDAVGDTFSGIENLTGSVFADILTGDDGANLLDGGRGNDVLTGGKGNDTYVVDHAGDTIVELGDEGEDTVESTITYTLGDHLEHLKLAGAGNINGTGNALANKLTGNDGDNVLDGGAGTDILAGGKGNDTYIVDSAGDIVVEETIPATKPGDPDLQAGTDLIKASVSYTLSDNVENLTLTGEATISGTGNTLDNVITGNVAANTLSGDAGDDILIGGKGGDTLLGGDGTDTASYAGAEAGILASLANAGANTGEAEGDSYGSIENLTGSAFSDTLTGDAHNNRLDGGVGNDVLTGGKGDDTYVVDRLGDQIVELANEGSDTIESSIGYTLAGHDHVENLTLTGKFSVNATGNALNNRLTGNDGSNVLDGGSGDDVMRGGSGHDSYKVDSVGDIVSEYSYKADGSELLTEDEPTTTEVDEGGKHIDAGGVDSVVASISYTLGEYIENLTLAGAAVDGTGNALDNTVTGNSSNNILKGLDGNDRLIGGGGKDRLEGGLGNDALVVDSTDDEIVEAADSGIDTVEASVDWTLGDHLEHLTLTGSALLGTGNALDNRIVGNALDNKLSGGVGDDYLDGGKGNDTLIGGAGDDTYLVDSVTDVVTEAANDGIDLVLSKITHTLATNVENLILLGEAAIDGKGNALDNELIGNAAGNRLDGGAGNDVMKGGLGADIYTVDSAGDQVVEEKDAGVDRVEASISHTLGAHIENLLLTGGTALDGTGNELDNEIIGNAEVNVLDGKEGNDRLIGGGGSDTLKGGKGDDTYVISDATATIVELDGEGYDKAQSSVTYTIGDHVEDLVLTGNGNIHGTGSAGDNRIVGNDGANTLSGLGGNDHLDGGKGADTLAGGSGDDEYVVDSAGDQIVEGANDGFDTVYAAVSYKIGENVEALILTGAGDIDGTGSTIANTILGTAGKNRLDGGLGNDRLVGGLGDDTYVVDKGDTVVEEWDGGVDTIESSESYTLGDNLEDLTLLGTGAINGTGNSGNNTIIGNNQANVLKGDVGDDVLEGGAGADTIDGGYGYDTASYKSSNAAVTVNLATGGASGGHAAGDTLKYMDHLEGSAFNDSLTGDNTDNRLDGGLGADTLSGGGGNDILIVDNQGDLAYGGADTDVVESSVSYTIYADVENLTLTGKEATSGTGNALANIIRGNDAANVLSGANGNDTLIGGRGADTLIGGAGNDVASYEGASEGVTANLADASKNLGEALGDTYDTIEFLVGSSHNDILTGNDSDNRLDGGAGSDLLTGGKGNDTYVVDHTADRIVENTAEGTDTVESSVSYILAGNAENVENLTLTGTLSSFAIGNALDNKLTGNDGDNRLDGGAGNDTMVGGLGDDTYVIGSSGDVVTEASAAGTDTVEIYLTGGYTLGTYVENLTLLGSADKGTGNASDNVLIGNAGSNILDGGTGNDMLVGGAGNDTLNGNTGTADMASYAYLTSGGVVAVLNGTGNGSANAGDADIDILQGIENLTGSNFADTLTGDGNANRLDGGLGTDTLVGGTGNDVYVVDDVGDVVTEEASAGTDTIEAYVSLTLAANVENLTLMGGGNLDATGNALVNVIIGNAGNNKLDGGVGTDTMKGGKGDDIYFVDNAADVVTELTGEGTDAIITSVGYDMVYQYHVENLTMTGAANGDLRGNDQDNIVTGNDGANKVDGYSGSNILIGGKGNDTLYGYYGASDTADYRYLTGGGVTASLTSGTASAGTGDVDTLQYIEHLSGSTFADTLTGDTGNNTLSGGDGNDTLEGGAGSDTLIGGAGADALKGGAGDDTYIVDELGDSIIENAAEGTDHVQAFVNVTLSANVENLTLNGMEDLNGTGNALNNTLNGNAGNNTLEGGDGADTLHGGAGNDILVGGVGADGMYGGTGDDIYYVDNASDGTYEMTAVDGTDLVYASVTYALSVSYYVENLTLTGTGNIDGTGNQFDNLIIGNDGVNKLDGYTGTNTLIGGMGNDTLYGYYGIDTADYRYLTSGGVIATLTTATASIGTANAGTGDVDTLQYIENISGSTFADQLTGDANANRLWGADGDDVLDGAGGADVLYGGAGNDQLKGGIGDDTYEVDSVGDVVTELASAGTDAVYALIDWTLGANVENLFLTGGAISGTGNNLVNIIAGNGAANRLDGGAGADTMKGGKGDDIYFVDNASDVVTEVADEGFDTIITSIAYDMVYQYNVENLTMTGSANGDLRGNASDNLIIGNDGANKLDGYTGANVLIGGMGNDTLYGYYGASDTADYRYVASGGVTASLTTSTANAGTDDIDTLQYIEHLTGSAFADTLTGDAAVNILSGAAGDDLLNGMSGNDQIYGGDGTDSLLGALGADYLDGGEGNDWAVYIGSAAAVQVNLMTKVNTGGEAASDILVSIENLQGSNYADTLTGDLNDNLLQGGLGNDTLNGGAGSDTAVYWVLTTAVTGNLATGIVNAGVGDIDTLTSIENIFGGSGNDTFVGNDADNRLNGHTGNDTLTGGKGNDTYVLDNAADVAVELADEGSDTIEAAFTYALGDNFENLLLTGTGNIEGTGNASNNKLTGNTGSNVLIGGAGDDELDGGAGNDTLVGGEGADTFRMDRGSGQDLLNSADTDGGADKLLLGEDVGADQLWFTRNGDDLLIDIIGSGNRMTVLGWYASTANQLDRIELGDGSYADANDVERLRETMAAFAPPEFGQTNLDTLTRQSLTPVLAANWHSNQAA